MKWCQAQIAKTLDFVFYGSSLPGAMDKTGDQQWARTLSALQKAGLVSPNMNSTAIRAHLLPPE